MNEQTPTYPATPSTILELRDLVRAMKTATGWNRSEIAVLNDVSETLFTHVENEHRKCAREVGECLTDMLRGGKPLGLALEETGRIFGADLEPLDPGPDGGDQ